MASVLAIVSKAVFEKIVKAKGSGELGDVLGIDRYTSKHASLSSLEEGGALFLVTVRPPDEALWLVGILENPTLGNDGWLADPSTAAIADVSSAKDKLQFATGAGLKAKKGALGMSLQTPRVLTDGDAELLRAAAGGKQAPRASKKKTAPAVAAKTIKKPAKAAEPAKPASAGKAKAGKTTTKPKKAKPAAADDDGDGVAAITAALAEDDGATALTAALATWRTTRSTALADLIDVISERVSGAAIDNEQDWVKTASAKDPLDLGRLLPAITALPVSFLPSAAERLAAFPDDPRLAKAVATWALDPPTTSSSAYPFWTKLLDAVARIGDARVVAAFAKRRAMPQEASKQFGAKAKNAKPSQFWGKFYTALEKTGAKIEALPPPATADDTAIKKLAKAAGKLAVVEADDRPVVTAGKRAPAPAVAGTPLEQAVVHAAAGRVQGAIDALLVAWRAHRAPVIADLIDRANRLVPGFDHCFPVEAKAADAAWAAAYAADPIAALPQLVRHVNVGGAAAAERHVAELATLPDDPRISIRLAEISCGFGPSPERTQYWKSFWELLARIGDVRTVAPLRVQFDDFKGTYYNHHRQGKRIVGDFVLAPPEIPSLDAAAHKLVNKVEAAIAKLEAAQSRTELGLVDAIARDWADNAPRLVYADWLMEREHPRGEAIVLGCKAARTPAEDKRLDLLVSGKRDSPSLIFGPISDLAFACERGIPNKVDIKYDASALTWRQLAGYPLLRLVDTIDLEAVQRGQPTYEDMARVMLDPGAGRLTKVKLPRGWLSYKEAEPLVATQWKLKEGTFVRK